jgi:hypothetical protein
MPEFQTQAAIPRFGRGTKKAAVFGKTVAFDFHKQFEISPRA